LTANGCVRIVCAEEFGYNDVCEAQARQLRAVERTQSQILIDRN